MMKRVILVILSALAVLFLFDFCGQENGKSSVKTGEAISKTAQDSKKGEQIDVDKLDIPDRMKEAIKSGRIPMERVKEFLEMRKGGDAPVVKVISVKKKNIHVYLVLNGSIEPEKKVEVFSRLAAYVKKIVKEEGDIVKTDDILALLDDKEIIISYQQAKIQLKQAELTYKDEEKNFQRSQELREEELISVQDFQTSEATFKKAKLDYEDKFENFKNLELQLNYTKIRTPVSGFVTERLIEVGDRVTSNQQVFTVEDFSPLLVKVYVPTVDTVNLKKGMKARISTDVLPGETFDGNIKLINPRIDSQSGTVKITLEVYDKTLKLKPGMFVEVRIVISNNPEALVIPKKAIIYREDRAFVYVFDRGQVFQHEVSIGVTEGDDIEIKKGLQEGNRVVSVGIEGLKDKMRVRIDRVSGQWASDGNPNGRK